MDITILNCSCFVRIDGVENVAFQWLLKYFRDEAYKQRALFNSDLRLYCCSSSLQFYPAPLETRGYIPRDLTNFFPSKRE